MVTRSIGLQSLYKLLKIALVLFLSVALFHITGPGKAFAETSESLEITGGGVTTPLKLTLTELEAMEQYQHVYSTINTWPTKRWYTARGVKLRDLLDLAGIKKEAKLIKFISKDGYEVTLTVKELLKDKRYYFPRLKDNHPSDGSIPGSAEGAVEVEPILALVSAEGSDNPADMNDRDALQLIFGQRAVTEQTNHLFLKHVSKIEVLTTDPEKWDPPKASIPSGTVVPEGTVITLGSKFDNEVKIYYTIDGSTPTVNSPMFNWSASRWWPLRNNLESVNRPIEIKEDIVIKAIVVGPGKEDSEVVTFTYKVDRTGKLADPTKIPGGPPTSVTLDRNEIDLPVGSTFRLEASVAPFNAVDQRVVWSSSDTSVATVDAGGLVMVVGRGTAIITAKTIVGGHVATCIVRGLEDEKSENDATEHMANTEEEPSDLLSDTDEQKVAEKETAVSASIYDEEPEITDRMPEPAGEATAAAEEDQEVLASTTEGEAPELEGNWRYLVRKQDIEANFTTAGVTSMSENSPNQIRVYEITFGTVMPIPLPARQKNLAFYIAAIILLLLLSGAGKKYIEFVKEL